MGKGVDLALDKLEMCIEKYKEYGIEYYPPWLVIISDGIPSDNKYELELVTQRVADMCDSDNLVVIQIAIGNEADKKNLSKLAQGRENIQCKV